MDRQELANEINADPVAMGYAAHVAAGAHESIAHLLNAPRPGVTVWRGVIPAHEIISATVPAEWAALTADEKQRYQTLTGAGDVDTGAAHVRTAFAAMFGPTTQTRTNLTALAQRQGSRAEELWGAGVVVTHAHVTAALAG